MDYFESFMTAIRNLLTSILVFLAYCSGRYFLKKYEIKWKAIIFTSLAILGFSFGLTLNFDQGMVILFATLIVPGLLGALGIFKEWNRER